MKNDGHLGRCYLKGRDGDAANAILTAVGYNFRLLLAWLRILAPDPDRAPAQLRDPFNDQIELVNGRLRSNHYGNFRLPSPSSVTSVISFVCGLEVRRSDVRALPSLPHRGWWSSGICRPRRRPNPENIDGLDAPAKRRRKFETPAERRRSIQTAAEYRRSIAPPECSPDIETPAGRA